MCQCSCVCVCVLLMVVSVAVSVPDNASPWDGRPSASPSLSEVAPLIDSLSTPSPSSHLASAPHLPHLPPQDVPQDRKSPPRAELLIRDPVSQARRVAAGGGSSRAKKEGGRPTHQGHRVQQPTADAEGCKEGPSGEAGAFRSSRGASKERSAGDSGDGSHCSSSSKVQRSNGTSGGTAERWSDWKPSKPREPDGGPAESRSGRSSGTAAGRKATVSPGPWKIPGSDKLPSALRAGAASTLSR